MYEKLVINLLFHYHSSIAILISAKNKFSECQILAFCVQVFFLMIFKILSIFIIYGIIFALIVIFMKLLNSHDMNFKQWIFLLLCIPLFNGATSTKVHFFKGSLTNARDMAANEQKLYFVDFTASWCMPCQWMDETTFSDARVAAYIEKHYIPVKIDIDDFDGYAIKQLHDIKLLPSILIFNAKGETVARYEESLSPSKLLHILEKYNTPENRKGGTGSATPPIIHHQESIQQPNKITRAALKPATPVMEPRNQRTPLPKVEIKPKTTSETPATASPSPSEYSNTRTNTTLPVITDSGLYRFKVSRQASRGYSIQTGIFGNYGNVLREAAKLENLFEQPIIVQIAQVKGKTAYRIMVGEFDDHDTATRYQAKMKQQKVTGFVRDLSSVK